MIKAGGEGYSVDDALAVAVGYAFDERQLVWQRPRKDVEPPEEQIVHRWAYRTYDCIPPDPGPGLAGVDLLVAGGLNGRVGSKEVAALIAMAPGVSMCLSEIPQHRTFWHLDEAQVRSPPDQDSDAWPIWRAYDLLYGAKRIKLAIAHKTLHHKRPSVFPLIDNKTATVLGHDHLWARVHSELNECSQEWESLEDLFASAASARPNSVRLPRLRLHDILVWTKVVGDQDIARAAGETILEGLS